MVAPDREWCCVPVLAPIRAFVDGLVHPTARSDALEAARHRTFLTAHLTSGLVALAGLPLYLGLRGAPGAFEVAVFGWLVLPLALAWLLSSTARLELAYALSAANHVGLALTVAAATGGAQSFALAWLLVVPLEAALSTSRRAVALASAMAAAGAITMLALDVAGIVTAERASLLGPAGMMLFATLTGTAYATGLALGSGALLDAGERLRRIGDTRYRLLAEHMTDLITSHAPNGAVTFVSPACEALLRVPPAELMSQGLFARIHVADRPAYLSAMSRATSEGVDVDVEFRVRGGSTTQAAAAGFTWVEMRCRPIESIGQTGSRYHVVAVMRDITERRSQQEALDAARQDAERASIAKTRFLATMSHELRTPLNAIIGFAEMLGGETAVAIDDARRRDYARLIHESGLHLLSVVNGILDMSRIESGKFDLVPEPCLLGRVVATCCEMIALKANDAGLTLTCSIAPDLPEIVADKRALKQILLNLLSNAVKFTPRGGSVTVTAAMVAGEIALVVSDTGIGISAEDLPRLGDPFFQAGSAYDRPFEGTGLGLSVVKGLVALHGGRLDITSRMGEGTIASIHLPRDCEAARRQERTRDIIAHLPARAPRASTDPETRNAETRKRA